MERAPGRTGKAQACPERGASPCGGGWEGGEQGQGTQLGNRGEKNKEKPAGTLAVVWKEEFWDPEPGGLIKEDFPEEESMG